MCPGFDSIDYDEITSKNPIYDSSESLKNEDKNLQKKENHSSTEIVKMRENNLSRIILNELNLFNDEHLILIYDKAIRATDAIKGKDSNGFHFIERYSSFKEIKIDTIKELIKINDEIKIKEVFNKVRELIELSTPLSHIKDAKNDHRLCMFSYNFTKNKRKRKEECRFSYHENSYLNINHLIMKRSDFHYSRYPQLIKLSQRIFVRRIRLKNNSQQMSDKKFIDWAYDYLINNDINFRRIDYYPVNQKQRSSLIISYLDYLAYFKKEEHASLTKNLYRAWTQKKHRESKKIPLDPYASLSKEDKKYLKEISKSTKKSEHEILSSLIFDKYLELTIQK